jgi:hypothetical protein
MHEIADLVLGLPEDLVVPLGGEQQLDSPVFLFRGSVQGVIDPFGVRDLVRG